MKDCPKTKHSSSPEEPENLPHKNQECDTTETKTSTKPSKKSSKNSQKNLQSKNPIEVSDKECANDKSDIIDNNKKSISEKDIPTGEYQGKNYSIHDFCVNIEKVNISNLPALDVPAGAVPFGQRIVWFVPAIWKVVGIYPVAP